MMKVVKNEQHWHVQLHDQKQAMVDARTDPETTPEEVEMSYPKEVAAAIKRMGNRQACMDTKISRRPCC
jgi:hypothetical protein